MKRVGHLMEQITSLDNLYQAYRKASRGKLRNKEVLRFSEQFDENIRTMRNNLINGSFAIGDYRYFTIYDPKERIICAAPFRERVMQHAVMNICHPYFDRGLIDTTYATRKGKGVYAAIDKSVKALSHYEYTVKLDFRKYYDSVNHDVLKGMLRRMFKDAALLELFDRIIDSYSVSTGKGLPIGNLTSQYFANLYLSGLDHKVKELWHADVYVRYMDDMLLVGNDREALRRCVVEMKDYAASTLMLSLKPPIFRKTKDGQVFLGYKIMPFRYKLSGRSKKRFRSKLLRYNKLYERQIWNENQYEEHVLPLLSFAQHAESRAFRKSCIEIMEKVTIEKWDESREPWRQLEQQCEELSRF